MNSISVAGFLGKDPELKVTDGGLQICKFSIGENYSAKKNGEWNDETQWHNVVVFGKRAETVNKNFRKGDQIILNGELRMSTYTNKEGNEKMWVEIIMRDFTFGKQKSKSGGDTPQDSFDDDDIPF